MPDWIRGELVSHDLLDTYEAWFDRHNDYLS